MVEAYTLHRQANDMGSRNKQFEPSSEAPQTSQFYNKQGHSDHSNATQLLSGWSCVSSSPRAATLVNGRDQSQSRRSRQQVESLSAVFCGWASFQLPVCWYSLDRAIETLNVDGKRPPDCNMRHTCARHCAPCIPMSHGQAYQFVGLIPNQ